MDLSKLAVQRDKQLWLLEREGYCIPVYIKEFSNEDESQKAFAIWPAVTLKHSPFCKYREVVSPHACGQFGLHGGFILDAADKVMALFNQAYGVTPEFYYRWDGEYNPPPDETLRIESVEENDQDVQSAIEYDEEFLNEIVKRTQVCSLEAMKIVWAAFVQVGMQWMIGKHRPINFGFCTVFAAPYRSNWKSIMVAAYPKCYGIFHKPVGTHEMLMAECGMIEALRGCELLGVDKTNNTVRWKLELIPNKVWDKAVAAVEAQRIELMGKQRYALFIPRAIVRLQKLIVAAFRYHVCRAVEPCANATAMGGSGDQIIVASTPKGGIRTSLLARSSKAVVLDDAAQYKTPRLISLINREIEQVSRLPDVRRQVAELRIAGGRVVESSDEPKGETGVLVQHGPQSPVAES